MARGELKIPMSADTSGIEKAIKNGLIEPVENAEDALKKLAKIDAGKDLERDFGKAQNATEDLKKELDDTRDGLKKLGYAAKDAGDDTKRGMKGAEEGVSEMGREAESTAKEAAASFDGSADSILGAFQEVAANAFAGFGPAGALAGLAIAAGIGVAVGNFQAAAEAAEDLRKQAVEYAGEARDAGLSTEAWISGATRMTDRIKELEELKSKDWRWFWENDPSQLEDWTDALKRMGRPASEIGDVLSGTTKQINDYKRAVQKSKDAIDDEINSLIERNEIDPIDNYAEKVNALHDQSGAHGELLDQLNEEITVRKESEESYKRQADAGLEAAAAEAAAAEDKANRIKSAEEAVKGSVLDAFDSMRSAATEYATTEKGALDINRWLAYVTEHQAAVAQYQANIQAIKLSPEQWQNLLEMPEDQRTQWVAQFAALPEDARAPFAAALNDVGSTGGSQAAVAFDDSFNPDASVDVKADTAEATEALDALSKKRTAEVEVKTTGKAEAGDALDALAKKRNATIAVRADTDEATTAVNTWRRNQEARPVYITVKAKSGGAQIV